MDITIKHQHRLALYSANTFYAKRFGVNKGDKVAVYVHGLFQVGDRDDTEAMFVCEVASNMCMNNGLRKECFGETLYASVTAIRFIDGGPCA